MLLTLIRASVGRLSTGYNSFVISLALAGVLALPVSPTASPQEPTVLAPHKAAVPKLEPAQPFGKPFHQSAAGGLWMTGPNMKSALYLKNTMKTSPLTVTPIFYLSNGVRVTSSPVSLEPSGTAIVDINQSLAQQGIAPYATLYGYGQIEYDWPWAPVSASIKNVDALNSLIFIYPLLPRSNAIPPSSSTNAPSAQNLEGLWWKHEKNVSGFIALANVTGQSINATLRVTDNTEAQLARYQVTVSPHETKMLDLDPLKSTASTAGGIYFAYDGKENSLVVSGGLQDDAVGYSARLLLSPRVGQNSQPTSAIQLDIAELGLMIGTADPMMNFPYGTTFTPYSVVRNVSDQPATITPTVWWMSGGTPKSAPLSAIQIAPHHTVNLDASSLINTAGLKNFSGNVDLVLDTEGQQGAFVLAAGSVDQSNTYVFEVIPRAVGEGGSQALCFWSTADGDDTMVSLWNPADEAQDFTFTLFYSGGHYLYPVHMEPRATHVFNISEILHSGLQDSQGNVIPAAVQSGSAEIAGLEGEQQHILVTMDAGVYNVRKAICGNNCLVCNGVVNTFIIDDPFGVPIGGSQQETFYTQYNTGTQYNLNGQSSWRSSNTSLATVSSGLVNGVNPGAAIVSAQDIDYEPIYNPCATSRTFCTEKTSSFHPAGSTRGNVGPRIDSIDPDVVAVGTTVPYVTINGAGFGTSPTVILPPGVTAAGGQASADTKITLNTVVVSTNAPISPNSITVSVAASDGSTQRSNQGSFMLDGPYYMTVLSDQLRKCSGCTTTVLRLVTYQIWNLSNTTAGAIRLGETWFSAAGIAASRAAGPTPLLAQWVFRPPLQVNSRTSGPSALIGTRRQGVEKMLTTTGLGVPMAAPSGTYRAMRTQTPSA